MAQANTRSSSKQKRPAQGANGSSASKRATASSNRPARSGSNAKKASAKASAADRRPSSASSDNGTTSKLPIIAGLATGAAGLIGGAVLGKRLRGKPKRVLGIQVPGTGSGLDGLAKQVGKAAKQFKKAGKQVGELTDEVRAAREKAEEVGRAFS
jgi:hypothetical protein